MRDEKEQRHGKPGTISLLRMTQPSVQPPTERFQSMRYTRNSRPIKQK